MLGRLKTADKQHSEGSAPFGISRVELEGGAMAISVEGELDLSTAPRLKWMLAEAIDAECGRIVLDLSRVAFMDSTALGVLVGINRRLDQDARLAIVCARPNVLKIFEFAGLDGVFVIFPTFEGAVAYAQGSHARAG